MTPYISKAISVTRFPVILGPVMIHCQTGFDATPYRLFWGEMVGRITVPLFFFISGYLFFLKFDGSLNAFKSKLIKRVSSLIVPYILWNLLAFFFYWSIGIAEGKDFLSSFWVVEYHSGHSPADGPLWFLRTLILLLPLTPIIYVFNINKYLCIGSLILYLFLFSNYGIFKQGMAIGFACFNLGAFGALSNIGRLLEKRYPPQKKQQQQHGFINKFVLVYFIILCILDYKLRLDNGFVWGIVHWSVLTTGSMLVMTLTSLLGERTTIILDYLGKASFFIFCLHEPIIPYVRSIFLPLAGCGDLGYTMTVVSVVVICLAVFEIMKRICPSVLKILNGGR